MTSVDLALQVRRYWYEVFRDGDLDVLGELFHDPYVRHARSGTTKRSLESFRSDMVQYRRMLRSLRPTFHLQTVDGDNVWSRVSAVGLNHETGDTHIYEWLQLHRFADGKVAETWELYEVGADWDH